MRRGIVIVALGLAAAGLAYAALFHFGTSRSRALLDSEQPELAWLRDEFNLSPAEFERISALHDSYLPKCLERCRAIGAVNKQIDVAFERATEVTPEIEGLIAERARLRAQCQTEMARHFLAIAQTMPAAQGARYLQWARENTCLHEEGMNPGPALTPAAAGARPAPSAQPTPAAPAGSHSH